MKTAVCFRSYKPSGKTITRLEEYASMLSSIMDVWVYVDTTFYDDKYVCQFEQQCHHLFLDTFNESDMINAFPDLINIRQKISHPSFEGKSLAWGFHIEVNVLFYRNHKYDYVWFIEDDVGISGDVVSFFNKYNSHAEDLLGYGIWPALDDWYWLSLQTTLFGDTIEDPIRTREHIQRFSARLLETFDDFSTGGIIAWSEVSSVTLTRDTDHSFLEFDATDIGSSYNWNTSIAEDKFTYFCKLDNHSKIYHKLDY